MKKAKKTKKKTLKNGGGGLLSLLPAPKNPIKDKKTPNKPRLTNIKPNISPTTHDPTVISSSDLKPESSSSEYLSNEHYSYNNWEGSSINTYSNYHHDQSLEHQQIQDNDQTQSEWMPDDEVIQKLGGRRGKEGPIKIKEISAADQMADAWQAQIADITRSSKGSGSGHSNLKPNKVQKRKHNLMYLAYQATAMENDLKEQYATNKKTKRETQAKYGF